MRDRLDEFGTEVEVALITFAAADRLADYTSRTMLPYTVLRDPSRVSYRAYGLGRATLARVWGLRAGKRYLELFRENRLRGLGRPTDDTRQLGGDFVIAPDGTLAWGFWGQGPEDRPSVDDLVRAVSHARGDSEQP